MTANTITFDPFDTLLQLLNLPAAMRANVAGICRTSDGFYLLREKGDIGYNLMLGKPNRPHPGPGLDNTRRIWSELSPAARIEVRRYCRNPDGSVLLDEFGIADNE